MSDTYIAINRHMGSYQSSLSNMSGLGRQQHLCEYPQSAKGGTPIADENTHRSTRHQHLMLFALKHL